MTDLQMIQTYSQMTSGGVRPYEEGGGLEPGLKLLGKILRQGHKLRGKRQKLGQNPGEKIYHIDFGVISNIQRANFGVVHLPPIFLEAKSGKCKYPLGQMSQSSLHFVDCQKCRGSKKVYSEK